MFGWTGSCVVVALIWEEETFKFFWCLKRMEIKKRMSSLLQLKITMITPHGTITRTTHDGMQDIAAGRATTAPASALIAAGVLHVHGLLRSCLNTSQSSLQWRTFINKKRVEVQCKLGGHDTKEAVTEL
jgi:hypothetical protein